MAPPISHAKGPLAFRLSCWVLGLAAFSQLITAGVGLAHRVEQSREVRIVTEYVPKIISVPAPTPAPPVVASNPASTPLPPTLPPPLPPDPAPLPPARGLKTPPIADPNVERLVLDARAARIRGDVATALIKLEEAAKITPLEPNMLYETGLLYEEMAAFEPSRADDAAEAYLKLYNLRTTGAGALFELAAAKIRDGISLPAHVREELALGRPVIFNDDKFTGGQRIVLTIPIQCAPGTEINAGDIEPIVRFFDHTPKDGIQPAVTELSRFEQEWITLPFDFATGEERVRITYILPTQDESQIHLFGKRTYYGQIIDLYYKGELIDSYSWPRHLASYSGNAVTNQPASDSDIPQFISDEELSELPPGILPPAPGEQVPLDQQLPPGDIPQGDNPEIALPPLEPSLPKK